MFFIVVTETRFYLLATMNDLSHYLTLKTFKNKTKEGAVQIIVTLKKKFSKTKKKKKKNNHSITYPWLDKEHMVLLFYAGKILV